MGHCMCHGRRELILPVAQYLGIPRENVFANRMNWQWDDDTNSPTKLVGFDLSEPTAHNQGKPQAIAAIRQRYPYKTIVMIGGAARHDCVWLLTSGLQVGVLTWGPAACATPTIDKLRSVKSDSVKPPTSARDILETDA